MPDDTALNGRVPLSPDVLPPTGSPPPIKVQRNSPLLPPVNSDSLNISKRRRLDFSSPITDDLDEVTSGPRNAMTPTQITPSKQRSLSSPPKSLAKRTPSLQDRPIPVLSPPSRSANDSNTSSHELVKNSRSVSFVGGELGLLHEKNLSPEVSLSSDVFSTSAKLSQSLGSPKKRSFTAPFLHGSRRNVRYAQIIDPKIKEALLGKKSLVSWKERLDLIAQNRREKPQNGASTLDILTENHRELAQQAALDICREQNNEIKTLGSIEEFRNQVRLARNLETLDSVEEEGNDNDDEKDEDENKNENDNKLDHDIDEEWFLKYVLEVLDIDYGTLFSKGHH